MRNRVLAFMILWVFLAIFEASAQTQPEQFVTANYGQARRLVPVSGTRRLNLICVGHGKPTVIFLYGLGGGTFDWRKVQPDIGKLTQACTYDRAGNGFSDAMSGPSDARNAVADLHALLRAAQLPRPVILVGHSLGGLYATLYAQTFPKDVSGLVLVEPAFDGQAKAIADAVGPRAADKIEISQRQIVASLEQCVSLARRLRLSSPAEAKSECLDNPPDPDPAVHREKNEEAKSVGFERALLSEFRSANIVGTDGKTADDSEFPDHVVSFGTKPVVVLTRGNSATPPGLTPEESRKAERAWRAGHDRLAALSRNGVNIVVPHTDHFIQLDRPDVVVAQIKRVLHSLGVRAVVD